MPDAADLAQQLADEDRAKQRQYVLANTRARWSFVGVGVALLVVIRLVRWVPVSWWFIVAFATGFVAANYAMFRLARDAAFRPWYAHLNIAVGAALISVVLAALGPTGHALYVAYMIAPLQAALYLGRTEAWQALILNLTGFALVTAIRAGPGTGGGGGRPVAPGTPLLPLPRRAAISLLPRVLGPPRAAPRDPGPGGARRPTVP